MSGQASEAIRVFPRKTAATPTDDLAFWPGKRTTYIPPKDMPVYVSCSFTWDKSKAERIADEWRAVGYLDVRIGGPAYGDAGGDFTPGMFLERGYVMTSRGCPNRCDFCFVPKREGGIRELPITEGWDVLDSNLLACSDRHVEAVFAMLRTQNRCVRFSGGLEAARIDDRIICLLRSVKLPQSKAALFLAYDRAEQAKSVEHAISKLVAAGMKRRQVECYVLMGRDGDTLEAAEGRCREVLAWGGLPFAMLYRDKEGKRPDLEWRRLQRKWCRPPSIFANNPGLR